jgi:molybdopterin molybdotransferase
VTVPDDVPRLLDLAAARERVIAGFAARTMPVETVALAEGAGRILAQGVQAPADVPGFTHSAMDGYAVRANDLAGDAPTALRLGGASYAGRADVAELATGECARITTGAALPHGADTVVIQEHARVDGGQVTLEPGTARGANVRSAHDDWRAGDAAIAAGTRLSAEHLATLASFGATRVDVRARPRVATIVTGDELVEPGLALAHGLRYDSNSTLLRALLGAHGAQPVSVRRVGDDRTALAQALLEAARSADLILTSGGASVGDTDFMPALVAELGNIWFWKARIRPGMPVLFGQVRDTPIAVLPGNPLSVYATFRLLVRPALATLLGCPALDPPARHARLSAAVEKNHARREFRRARLQWRPDGTLWVSLHPGLSSGALRGLVESDVLAELAPEARRFEAGEIVPVYPLDDVHA